MARRDNVRVLNADRTGNSEASGANVGEIVAVGIIALAHNRGKRSDENDSFAGALVFDVYVDCGAGA